MSSFWGPPPSYLINTIPECILNLDTGRYKSIITDLNREEIRESLIALFRSVSNEDRINMINELEKQVKIKISKDDCELAKPLNWGQIERMSAEGIEIGSHTVTHPFLTKLSKKDIISELIESKKRIEGKVGKQIKSIAYPAGDYNETTIECVRDCGYEFGISYRHKIQNFSNNQPYTIPRIHIELDTSFQLFQANLLFPQLFVKYGS